MKTLLAAVIVVTPLSAFAQSAMPGQTMIASNMLRQTRVPHVAVLSHMPKHHVIPPVAFPGDRADYTSVQHDPVPDTHEAQPSF
jgi:hypothetical protein